LCEKNLKPEEDDTFVTTDEDLAGFWDMVMIQVEELDTTNEGARIGCDLKDLWY
jgi:hypothetical protein